ncbi:hypothetical protein AMTRI_Chr13g116040 [Amborella trichopoda]
MLSRVENVGDFAGFRISDSDITISHLQYADNTLIFCDVELLQVENIVRFLEVCEVTLRLKVNFHESSMVGINCNVDLVANLASAMGCKVGSFPVINLGLPISDSRLSTAVWDKVNERIQVKLDQWKHKYLSLGGRVTLLRSCLANLPVYQMALIKMPASVAKKIEKMTRDFLWAPVLTRRNTNCLDGIECVPPRGKDVWVFGTFEWSTKPSCANSGSVVCIFKPNFGTKFYFQSMIGECPLKYVFPNLFGIVTRSNLKVNEAVERRGQLISWNIYLAYSRLSNVLLSQWCALMELLDKVYISHNAKDEMIWEIESDGLFSVKLCYNIFFHDKWRWFCPQIAQIWKWSVPHKVQVFIWLAAQNNVLTVDHLIKKRKILPNVCLFCKSDGEIGAYLFIHCSFKARIWHWLFRVLGISLVLPRSVEGIVMQFALPHLPKLGKVLWKISKGVIL